LDPADPRSSTGILCYQEAGFIGDPGEGIFWAQWPELNRKGEFQNHGDHIRSAANGMGLRASGAGKDPNGATICRCELSRTPPIRQHQQTLFSDGLPRAYPAGNRDINQKHAKAGLGEGTRPFGC